LNCLNCTSKACRSSQQDCNGQRDAIVEIYKKDHLRGALQAADDLVSGGKAGTVSRLDEIVAYARNAHIENIAIAYCFAMEREAKKVKSYLQDHGLRVVSFRCSINGIPEKILLGNDKNAVNCNPVGQAEAINRSNAELVIEMGLCLGHDILFHKYLKKPFTVFMVKDRVHKHIPQKALEPATQDIPPESFLDSLPSDFYLKSTSWLEDQLERTTEVVIIDLRGKKAFDKNAIPNSVQCSLQDLAERINTLVPNKNQDIIILCNGGFQSLYAVMYLRMKGYSEVYSLSGGFSRWEKEGRVLAHNDK